MISASAACGSPRSPTSTRSRFPTTSHVSRDSWSRTASAAATSPRVAWASVPGRASSTMSERSSSPGRREAHRAVVAGEAGLRRGDARRRRQQHAQRGDAGLARRRLELVAPVQDDPQEPRDRLRALRVAPEPPEVLRDARRDERAGTEPRRRRARSAARSPSGARARTRAPRCPCSRRRPSPRCARGRCPAPRASARRA